MYWCWARNRPLGGAMLKLITLITVLAFSVNAFSCWKFQGEFSVDGETWKIDQKVDHDKNYSLPMDSFILNFKVSQGKDKAPKVFFEVFEKKGITQVKVTTGQEDLKFDKSVDIYAKGLEGQPNSILTLKLSNI